jgi:hypothetical protein
MNEVFIVKFYFSSGEIFSVKLCQESLDQMVNILKKEWHNSSTISEKWGVNFSNVTHYEIFNEEWGFSNE